MSDPKVTSLHDDVGHVVSGPRNEPHVDAFMRPDTVSFYLVGDVSSGKVVLLAKQSSTTFRQILLRFGRSFPSGGTIPLSTNSRLNGVLKTGDKRRIVLRHGPENEGDEI